MLYLWTATDIGVPIMLLDSRRLNNENGHFQQGHKCHRYVYATIHVISTRQLALEIDPSRLKYTEPFSVIQGL